MHRYLYTHKLGLVVFFVFILLIIFAVVLWRSQKPSQNRNWNLDQKILSHADITDSMVTVHNVRNFSYKTETEYTTNYYDKTYDVNKIKNAYYVVEPFTSFSGPAHTFLSFEFEDNQFVSVSIEIRKREGQVFSAWKSAFPYYELMYVVADENDVVKLRSNFRKDKVFVYPVKADRAALRNLFLDYMDRVNQLYAQPEFYNLFTNNCTTNIVDSINRATGTNVPWSYEVLLPSYSDRYALSLDLLDTNLPLDQARAKYQINDRSEKFANDPNYSIKIRETN